MPKNVFTLKQWCKNNGYPGVTKECVLSAVSSEDPKVKKWGKDAMVRNLVAEETDKEDIENDNDHQGGGS